MTSDAGFDDKLASQLETLNTDGVVGLKGAFTQSGLTPCAKT